MSALKYLFLPAIVFFAALYGASVDSPADASVDASADTSVDFPTVAAATGEAKQVAQVTTKPATALNQNAELGNKTFVISYPENCKVTAINVNNDDMRANVECDGKSQVHKWDVDAVGSAIATTSLSHNGMVGITIFNSSDFDWSTDEYH